MSRPNRTHGPNEYSSSDSQTSDSTRSPTFNLYEAITTQLRDHQPTPRHRLIGTIAHQHPAAYADVKSTIDELEAEGIIYRTDEGVYLTHA